MLRSHHLLRFYAFVGVWAASSAVFADSDYRQELTTWRQQHEINLKAENSWLTVAGLFFLNQGKNTFGSGPLNDIVLPTGAPAEAGLLEFDGTRVMLRAKQVLTVNGKPTMAVELKPAGVGRPVDMVTIGPLSYFVMLSGERIAIRVRDQNSEFRRRFTALKWYAPNEVYRVTGRFEPYPTSKSVKVPNILGDLDTYKASGLVAFTINGQRHRLEAYDVGSGTDRGFFIVFRDLTSGRETYPSARFLNAGLPNTKGEVVLDFNKAHNPPCAYNPYTTCPLPTAQNRLPARVDAGEFDYRTTPAR